jgi:hypothetical protein
LNFWLTACPSPDSSENPCGSGVRNHKIATNSGIELQKQSGKIL